MKKVFLLFSNLLFLCIANACLNEYHVSKAGKETIDHFEMHDLHFIRDFNITKINEELDKLLKDTSTGKERVLYIKNNIAVKYIKLGKLNEARSILEELLKTYPNEYNVIVNLGTLYELMGENSKALTYIKKAMSINVVSHRGSEWFHVKVLEYKLKSRTDEQIPGDLILNLNRSGVDARNMAQAVAYQLKERIPFTPTPNLMMAKILLEYGDYIADSISIEAAYVIYGIAQEYDSANVLPLASRKSELEPIFKKFKKKAKIPDYKNYFVTSNKAEEDKKTGKEVSNLLEKGLKKIFLEEQKTKSSGKSFKNVIYICGGIVLSVFLVILFFRFRNRLS